MKTCLLALCLCFVPACGDEDKETHFIDMTTCPDAGAAGSPAEPSPGAGTCENVSFSEDFEAYAEGAALDPSFRQIIEGPNSSVRLNLDTEGLGSADSNRYVLFSNGGSEPNSVETSAVTPAVDASGCSAGRLSFSVIVFSLELTENDHAFVEVRGNGSDWIPLYMPFPSPDFPAQPDCRAGGQTTGCTAWKSVELDLPRVALGPDLELRFRANTLTAVSDFFGFDSITITATP